MNQEKSSHKRIERRDAAENRQRILDAALSLFEQNDVEQVSMNQIAKEAGIGPGTLYRRYSNKGELCLDLIKGNLDLFFKEIKAYLEENYNEPPSKRLKEVMRIFLQFKEAKVQLLKGVEDATPKYKSIVTSPLYNQLHQIFVTLFEEINEKEFLVTNSVFRTDMLLTACTSDSYLFQREVRGYSPEMILEQIYSTLCSTH
ncbi:TetR/AcrR family transcriptional regulator [Peribacillus muralis]|uniref:TetR/AcrR family transcriptional regulator n=1 Tax=Peribacillus muralis TaxID=264697 RepID=UPI00070C941C|nr:TetR/AcrR family transcriptional regulator [Peribacillus muralis]